MGNAWLWTMDLIGPAILLVVLIWLVIRVRTNRDAAPMSETREGTRELYAEEDALRRQGIVER